MPVYRVRWIAQGNPTHLRNTYLLAADPNEAIGGAIDVHNTNEGDFEIQSVADVSDHHPAIDSEDE
ncbi:MAG: hypothetical protein ABIR70_20005 [Bryobacteraceae bacterium]